MKLTLYVTGFLQVLHVLCLSTVYDDSVYWVIPCQIIQGMTPLPLKFCR